MKIKLNEKDLKQFNKLLKTMDNNIAIANMFLDFCSHYNFIDKNNFSLKQNKNAQFAREFLNFFDYELDTREDKKLFKQYVEPAIKELDLKIIKNNIYYKTIKPQKIKDNNYVLEYKKYYVLQPFVYEDVKVDNEYYQEISSIAFSEEELPYLVLAKKNINWMSITPNEIVTMQKSINEAQGNVITFGLGLGYYAFMVAEKENVTSVVVVENDATIIKIFKENILPLFRNKKKIKIIQSDAFSYCKTNDINQLYDYAFVDIWHSAEDGLPLYLKFKQFEKKQKCTFSYWLEESIICLYRRLLLILIEEQLEKRDDNYYQKAHNDLDKIINDLYFATKNLLINNYEGIHKMLSVDQLKKLMVKERDVNCSEFSKN